jgi:hypothetical protein
MPKDIRHALEGVPSSASGSCKVDTAGEKIDILSLVALVRTDVSNERSSSFIRVTRISELGTALAVTSN